MVRSKATVDHRKSNLEIFRKANQMQRLNSFCIAIFMLLVVTITSAQVKTFEPLHEFNIRSKGEGAIPHGALLRDAAGNLFGTTLAGGSGDGTVFKLD